MNKSEYMRGLRAGLPICVGYLSVSFAFGIFAVGSGLTVWQTVLISMLNVTSAGQLAGVPQLAALAPLAEVAATQLFINLRYLLMSVSMSQRLAPDVRTRDRFAISFIQTDEVFAVASRENGEVGRSFLYGLITLPYIGWASGTLIGAAAGNVLPQLIVDALGIAIYGMFAAIIIPDARRSKPILGVSLMAAAISCAFRFIPALGGVSGGISIIISAAAASLLFALVCPIEESEVEQ